MYITGLRILNIEDPLSPLKKKDIFMLTGFCFLFLTGIVWVIQGIFISDGSKKMLNMSFILGGNALIGCILTLPIGLFWKLDLSLPFLIALPAGGMINYLGFLFVNKAMQKGPNGVIWAMVQSAFAMPFLMGILFFGVECTWTRITGLLLLLTAMVILGRSEKNDDEAGNRQGMNWLLLSLIAYLTIGLSQSCINLPSYFVKEIENGLPATLFRGGLASAGTFLAFLLHGLIDRNCFNGKGCSLHTIGLGIGSIFASLLIFLGLDRMAACGAGAIGYPIVSGVAISVFMIYTAIRLKEKMTLPVICGILSCLCGIVVISL